MSFGLLIWYCRSYSRTKLFFYLCYGGTWRTYGGGERITPNHIKMKTSWIRQILGQVGLE